VSGIVGLVTLNGAPVDAALLRRMTAALAFRGPDGAGIWAHGRVGLGHTQLSTVATGTAPPQPSSLDGRVWIAADVRIDARADLVSALVSRGRDVREAESDPRLVLHAYAVWGEHCVDHLLGDFAFAIWDGPARRLFCARDHFGVKPFYYAAARGVLVFSNTLDCVRLHPGVDQALNDRAVGDFLLFGCNYDVETTAFSGIDRLPPAHTLSWTEGAVRRTCYWTLPATGCIRYRNRHDYVEHFSALLAAAVGDRLGTDRAAIFMSGGLDSTAVAATARRLSPAEALDLRAYTVVYDTLIPDRERDPAGVAAGAMGLGVSYVPADSYEPFQGWDRPELVPPEPSDDPFPSLRARQLSGPASHGRVVLCGEGGDELLWTSYVADLIGRVPLRRLVGDVARAIVVHRRRPGAGVRARIGTWLRGAAPRMPACPSWLSPGFAARFGLADRWEEVNALEPLEGHPLRAEAYRRLTGPVWPWYFESCDPGVTGLPIEFRYPLLDVRLVRYALAIPPLPWCIDKQILRLAMRGLLPESIRRRRKTPLNGDPLTAWLQRREFAPPRLEDGAGLGSYVDLQAVPPLTGGSSIDQAWVNLRPLCLGHWLTHRAGAAAERSA
jgi:asparagine synthase (glutamine-hydrolysing)